MARTLVTVTAVNRTGSDITILANAATASDGDNFPNNGKTFLIVTNGAGAPITVTVQTPRTVDGLAVAEYTNTVTNATTEIFGPFPVDTFNQADGTVYVDWSSATSITFEAFSL